MNLEPPSSSSNPNSGNSKSRQVWIWLLVAFTAINGGFTLWRAFLPTGAPTAKGSPQGGPPPRPVETVALKKGTGVTSLQLLGQVEPSQQSVVRAQTSGVVETVAVNVGDRVTRGQLLAVLDDKDQTLSVTELRARLAQEQSNLARLEVGTRPEVIAQRKAAVVSAKAREQEAQDNLKRTADLVKEGALSQRLLVEAQTTVDNLRGQRLAAEAALAEAEAGPIREEIEAQRARVKAAMAAFNQAQLSRGRTRIAAPADGVVRTRHVSKGDLVQANTAVITLVAADQLEIFLELPEGMSTQIKAGMPILLTARALPKWQSRTTITAVVPSADATSRRQRVRVQLDEVPEGLIAGMAVTGAVVMPSDRPSFVVSRDVLTLRNSQWFVFTIAQGKAKQVAVDLVADMGEQVAIYNPDLQDGQAIVLRGGDGLRDGGSVKVVKGTQS